MSSFVTYKEDKYIYKLTSFPPKIKKSKVMEASLTHTCKCYSFELSLRKVKRCRTKPFFSLSEVRFKTKNGLGISNAQKHRILLDIIKLSTSLQSIYNWDRVTISSSASALMCV